MDMERRDFLKALVCSVVAAGAPLPIGLDKEAAERIVTFSEVHEHDFGFKLAMAVQWFSPKTGKQRRYGIRHNAADFAYDRAAFEKQARLELLEVIRRDLFDA